MITPIVFCASFEPWLNAMTDADASCARRKRRMSRPGCARRKSQRIATISATPTAKPTSGATSVGISTFSRIPLQSTECGPLVASTAPATPPIRQCEELDGSAHHHVSRFQAVAPTRPPSITGCEIAAGSTMPLASVAATWVETSAPTTFSTAAAASATFGGTARVEIDVATALAASWKPFV